LEKKQRLKIQCRSRSKLFPTISNSSDFNVLNYDLSDLLHVQKSFEYSFVLCFQLQTKDNPIPPLEDIGVVFVEIKNGKPHIYKKKH
jgi:hypothetical protein